MAAPITAPTTPPPAVQAAAAPKAPARVPGFGIPGITTPTYQNPSAAALAPGGAFAYQPISIAQAGATPQAGQVAGVSVPSAVDPNSFMKVAEGLARQVTPLGLSNLSAPALGAVMGAASHVYGSQNDALAKYAGMGVDQSDKIAGLNAQQNEMEQHLNVMSNDAFNAFKDQLYRAQAGYAGHVYEGDIQKQIGKERNATEQADSLQNATARFLAPSAAAITMNPDLMKNVNNSIKTFMPYLRGAAGLPQHPAAVPVKVPTIQAAS